MPSASDRPAPRFIGLVVNYQREGAPAFADELAGWLGSKGLAVETVRNVPEGATTQPEDPYDRLVERCDMLVVLGGDGSLLGAARRAASRGKPILGIHWGGMGFLNECQPENARECLDRVLQGDYDIEERLMLMASLRREGEICCQCPALNDVAVTRETLSRILRIEVEIGGTPAASYQGDGILVATPTGSTGHSLSAGGPVLDPRVDVLVITPICVHTFNGRAVVVPSNERLRIRHFGPLVNVLVTLDGQVGMQMCEGDVLEITRAPWPARFVRFGGNRFYLTLRDKLNWRL